MQLAVYYKTDSSSTSCVTRSQRGAIDFKKWKNEVGNGTYVQMSAVDVQPVKNWFQGDYCRQTDPPHRPGLLAHNQQAA